MSKDLRQISARVVASMTRMALCALTAIAVTLVLVNSAVRADDYPSRPVHGIGLAAAQEICREGARVAICGLNERSRCRRPGRHLEPEVSPLRGRKSSSISQT
jgi:hypothetical protein